VDAHPVLQQQGGGGVRVGLRVRLFDRCTQTLL
jgi:hypothetical protein